MKRLLTLLFLLYTLHFTLYTNLYASFTITAGTVTLNHITISVSSDVTISADGELDLGDGAVNVGRNWSNSGNFVCGSSTVTFYTTYNSTFTGNTTFYRLVCETPGKELYFTENSTQAVMSDFILTGESGNLIKLRSSVGAEKWYISFPGSGHEVNFVNVQDSDALLNPVTAYSSTDAGNNNENWIFPVAPPTVSGLTQLAGDGNILASMQWTTSTVVVSSFTLADGNSDDVLFYLQITSVTTGIDEADWEQSWHASTSAYLTVGTTGYQWPALTEDGTYWWRVWVEDTGGLTSSTSTVLSDDETQTAKFGLDSVAPSPVSNLTALTGTEYDGDIVLNWTAPGNNGDIGNFSGGLYHIKWSTNNITDFSAPPEPSYERYVSTDVIASEEQFFTVTGLNPGTTYYFAIKARDTAGNWSEWSTNGVNTANFNGAYDKIPDPPSNIMAISNSSWTVNVSWGKPVPDYVDDLAEYKLYRAEFTFTSTTTAGVNQISTVTHPSDAYLDQIADIPAGGGTTYYYKIITFDNGDGDDGLFSEVLNSVLSDAEGSACPQLTDQAKVRVSVVYDNRSSSNTNNYGVIDGVEDADGTVMWDWPFVPDGGTITEYTIQISTDNEFSFYSSSETLSANVSTYTAVNLEKGFYHYARVKVTNDEAQSGDWVKSDGIYVNKKEIDGLSDDWTGTYTAEVDSITVSNNDALWSDKTSDQRQDRGDSAMMDISSFSISLDEYNIYFYFAYSSTGGAGTFDGKNWLQIMLDNDSTSEERVFRGRDTKYEDSYVSGSVPWEWVVEVISGDDLARVANHRFGNIRYGAYSENNSGYYYEVSVPLNKLGGSEKFLGKTVNFTIANFWNAGGLAIGDWAAAASNSNIVDAVTSSGTYTWDEVQDKVVDFYLQLNISTSGDITSARGVTENYMAPPDEPEPNEGSPSGPPAPDSALNYILYNIFIDGWYNGDTSNDDINDTNDYGGDFQGVIDKVDYLNEMGINVGYFGPPTEFGGGIWGFNIDDAFKHETKFGGTAKYIEMVKTLHNHNIDVMVDWVCGQVGGTGSPTAVKNPNFFRQEQFGGGTMQEFAEARAYWINNAIWYFSVCDAFRYDNPKFWNDMAPEYCGKPESGYANQGWEAWEFNRALRKITDRWDPQLYLMGEVPEDVGAYNTYTGDNGPMIHGAECMRSGGYKNNRNGHICSWVRPGTDEQSTATAGQGIRDQQVNWKNQWSINPIMMENHDETRFISRGRDSDGASWGYDSQIGYMTAVTVAGPVIIFYGGEVGLEGPYGGGDSAKMDVGGNVRLMEFDRVNVSPWTTVQPAIRKAIQAKANFNPLRSNPKDGGWSWLSFTPSSGDDVMVYRRDWGGSQYVICMMNRDAGDKTVSNVNVGIASAQWKNWLDDDSTYWTDSSGYLNKSGNYTITVGGHYGLILVKDSYEWANVTGTVTCDGSPVPNAIVDIDRKSHWTTRTDSNGYYSLSGDMRKVLTGNRTARCWAIGYGISEQAVTVSITPTSNNCVDFSLSVDNTAPAVPVGLSGQPRNQAAMLSWQPNTESDIQTYLIYRSETPIPNGSNPPPVFEVFKTFYYDNNLDGDINWSTMEVYNRLQNGTTYYYRIRAVDRNGNKSEFSNEVAVVPRMINVIFWLDTRDVGGITSANIAGGALAFSTTYWAEVALDSNGDGTFQKTFQFDDSTFLEYKYIANGTWEGVTGNLFLDGSAGTSNRGELTDGGAPDVEIVDEGNGEMVIASVWRYYNDRAPRTPSGLQVNAGPTQLTVGWTANAEPDLDHYSIWCSTHATASFLFLTMVGKNEINYVDVGLENNNTYYYKITATDNKNNTSSETSAVSNYPRATDTTAPSVPANVEVRGAGTYGLDGIKISWNKQYEGDLAGFNIYRSTNSGFSPDTLNKLNSTLIAPVTTYYNDQDIAFETTYYYRLVAMDSSGNSSAATSELTAHLVRITFEVEVGNIGPGTVQLLGDTAPLDWSVPIQLTQLGIGTSWYVELGLISNAGIRYRYSYNNNMDNKEQNFNTSSTDREYTIPYSAAVNYDDWEENPDIVQDVSVHPGSNAAYLYWDWNLTSEDILGYNIYRSTDSGQTPNIKVNTAVAPPTWPYTVNDLAPELTHYFTIKSVDGGNNQLESDASAVVSCFISSPVYVNFGVPYNVGESSPPWGDSSKLKLYLCVQSSTGIAVWTGTANMTNGKKEMDAENGTYRTTVPLLRGERYNFIFFAQPTGTPPTGLSAGTEYFDPVPAVNEDYDAAPSTAMFAVSTSSTSIAGTQSGWFKRVGTNGDARRAIYVPTSLTPGDSWYVFANFGETPTPPTYINAIPGNQQVTLQWSAPYGKEWVSVTDNVPSSSGESMKAADVVCGGVYHIYVYEYSGGADGHGDFANYAESVTVPGSSFTYTFTGLTNDVTYYYLIRSSDTFRKQDIVGNLYSTLSSTVSACPTEEYAVVKVRVNKGANSLWKSVRKSIAFQQGVTVSSWDEEGRSNMTATGRAVTMTAPEDDDTEQELSINLTAGTTYNFTLYAYSTYTITGLQTGTTYYDTIPYSGSAGMTTSTSTANITGHGDAWFGSVGGTGDSRRLLYVPKISELGGGTTLYVYCNFSSSPTSPSIYATPSSSFSILLEWAPYGNWGIGSESFKAVDVIAGGFYYLYRSSISAAGPYVLWASTDEMRWIDDDRDDAEDNLGILPGTEYFYVLVASDAYSGASGEVDIENLHRTGAPEFSSSDTSITVNEIIPVYFKVNIWKREKKCSVTLQ